MTKIKRHPRQHKSRRAAAASFQGDDSLLALFNDSKQEQPGKRVLAVGSSDESEDKTFDGVEDSLAVVGIASDSSKQPKSRKKTADKSNRFAAGTKGAQRFPRSTGRTNVEQGGILASTVLVDLNTNDSGFLENNTQDAKSSSLSRNGFRGARRNNRLRGDAQRNKPDTKSGTTDVLASSLVGLSLNDQRPTNRTTRTTRQAARNIPTRMTKSMMPRENPTGLSALFGSSRMEQDTGDDDDDDSAVVNNEIGRALTLAYAAAGQELPKRRYKQTKAVASVHSLRPMQAEQHTKRTAMNKRGLRRSNRAANATFNHEPFMLAALAESDKGKTCTAMNAKVPIFGGLALEPLTSSSSEKSKGGRKSSISRKNAEKQEDDNGSKHEPQQQTEDIIMAGDDGGLLAAFGDLSMNGDNDLMGNQPLPSEANSVQQNHVLAATVRLVKTAAFKEDDASDLTISPVPRQRKTGQATTPINVVIEGTAGGDDASDLSMSPSPLAYNLSTTSPKEETILDHAMLSFSTRNSLLQEEANDLEPFVAEETVRSDDILAQSGNTKRAMQSPNPKVDRKRLDSKKTPGKKSSLRGDDSRTSNVPTERGKECSDSSSTLIKGKTNGGINLHSVPEDTAVGGGDHTLVVPEESPVVQECDTQADTQPTRRSRRQRIVTDRFTIAAHTAGGRYLPEEEPPKVARQKSRLAKKRSPSEADRAIVATAIERKTTPKLGKDDLHRVRKSHPKQGETDFLMVEERNVESEAVAMLSNEAEESHMGAISSLQKPSDVDKSIQNDGEFLGKRRSRRERKQTDFLTVGEKVLTSSRGDEATWSEDDKSNAMSLSEASSRNVTKQQESDKDQSTGKGVGSDDSSELQVGDDLYRGTPSEFPQVAPIVKEKRRIRVVRHKPLATKMASVDAKDAPTNDTDEWSSMQLEQLREAHGRVDPTSVTFWFDIASLVDGKSAAECRDYWFALVKTPKVVKQSKRKTKQDKQTANCPSFVEDDMFDSTPMRGLLLPAADDKSKVTQKPSKMEIDLGSAIKVDSRAAGVAAASRLLDGDSNLGQAESGPKLGYKSYLQTMKRDVMRSQKETKGSKKKASSKYVEKGPRTLSDAVYNADIDMSARLTPGGTLKVQSRLDDDDDEDDFWNEMYDAEDEEDQY